MVTHLGKLCVTSQRADRVPVFWFMCSAFNFLLQHLDLQKTSAKRRRKKLRALKSRRREREF